MIIYIYVSSTRLKCKSFICALKTFSRVPARRHDPSSSVVQKLYQIGAIYIYLIEIICSNTEMGVGEFRDRDVCCAEENRA